MTDTEKNASVVYFWGLPGSMVPMDLALSGPPSGFLLFSFDSWMGMECLVGVLETPCCLEEISPCLGVSAWEKPGLAGAPWETLLVIRFKHRNVRLTLVLTYRLGPLVVGVDILGDGKVLLKTRVLAVLVCALAVGLALGGLVHALRVVLHVALARDT